MCRMSYCYEYRSMTAKKQRLTVTVDPELVKPGTGPSSPGGLSPSADG